MMLKSPIDAMHPAAGLRGDAAIDQIGRQMHGDEGKLEAAGEEAEHQQHIGAMAEGLGERGLERLLVRRGHVDVVAGGVDSASDSGTISSIRPANTISAVCQPKLSISATPIGANRNWPNEPAAVPAPSASRAVPAAAAWRTPTARG